MPHDTLPLPFLLRVGSDYGVLAGPETSSDAIFKSLSHRQYFLAFLSKHWPIALEGGMGGGGIYPLLFISTRFSFQFELATISSNVKEKSGLGVPEVSVQSDGVPFQENSS